jgi:hypothetical protein
MYESVNAIVCLALLIIFLIGVFSCLTANNKYNGMLKTIDGKFMDKDIMLMEHKYRHRVLTGNRPTNTKIFIEKDIYNIRISKIPMYILEDVAINTLYCIVLVGLTFTFLEIALLNKISAVNLQEVLTCGIVGLVLGLILLGIRMICRLEDKKEIAIIYMCNHLDNELEVVMDGVKIVNEGYSENQEDKETNKFHKEKFQTTKNGTWFSRNGDKGVPIGAKISKKANSTMIDETILEDVIEEIMS